MAATCDGSMRFSEAGHLFMTGCAGMAVVAALTRYQNGGSVAWLAPAAFAAVLGAHYLKRLRVELGVLSPSQARLWSYMFGERWWQLLLADPRLRSWPRLRRVLRRFFGGIVCGEGFMMARGVGDECASDPSPH